MAMWLRLPSGQFYDLDRAEILINESADPGDADAGLEPRPALILTGDGMEFVGPDADVLRDAVETLARLTARRLELYRASLAFSGRSNP